MAEKRKLTKEEKKMLFILESGLEHCDRQIAAFKDKDPDTAREWIIRSITTQKYLDAFNKLLVTTKEES